MRPYVTHLVASPSLRAIRTATAAFKAALSSATRRLAPVILNADFMETSASSPCNLPSSIYEIKARHGRWVDTSILEMQRDFVARYPGDLYERTDATVRERARRARVWLRKLGRGCGEDDAEIVVVSHGAFLRDLVQGGKGDRWGNTEMRGYVFEDWRRGDDEAKLSPMSRWQIFGWRNCGFIEELKKSEDPAWRLV